MIKPQSSPETTLHVINHTHWDREWFVPHTITSRWIPNLIRNLTTLVARNPDYEYLFDAQTMVIEDLEATDKTSYDLARTLIANHNLKIGPYYAQLEMRTPGAESLVRNLQVGTEKAKALGAATDFTAWDVDSFGHISQSPQLHALFGIDTVYLWRGPNQLHPFFWWQGADGTKMLAIDLFAGGYRNFYKVTSQSDLALPRLLHEVEKLRPYYEHGHIPVFDGFDLDKDPGDAASFFSDHFAAQLAANHVRVTNSSPASFAKVVQADAKSLPILKGEQISGKFSSVFPGTLSARTYSKLLANHAEQLLYRYAEPLSLLLPPEEYPEANFTVQTKRILQNLVHDVISGCSIDQVHDYAEIRAAQVTDASHTAVTATLRRSATQLANGVYAYTPATRSDQLTRVNETLYRIKNDSVGITKIETTEPVPIITEPVSSFDWHNNHYQASLQSDGRITLGKGHFGQLVAQADDGDAYWDEPRGRAKPLRVISPLHVTRRTESYAEVTFAASFKSHARSAIANVTLVFDDSPIVKWAVQLETTGTGFSIALRHRYGHAISKLQVGMQFDNVTRPFKDTNLLGAKLDPRLQRTLIGQRDIRQTFTFPLHNYISPTNNPAQVHLLAKGIRAYQTLSKDIVDIVLTRPTEWVMRPGPHKYHTGDAGPKFLVPGARSERKTKLECGLLVGGAGPDSIEFHRLVDQFINPPLIFTVQGSSGNHSKLNVFEGPQLITSVHQHKGKRLARVYNPTSKPHAGTAPKQITTCGIATQAIDHIPSSKAKVSILNWPSLPIGRDNSILDPASLKQLEAMRVKLQSERDSLVAIIDAYGLAAPHRLMHRLYVITRECMEAKLSIKWNQMRDSTHYDPTNPTAVDETLYKMATEYNDMRIVRRVYDYIVDLDDTGAEIARPQAAVSPTVRK